MSRKKSKKKRMDAKEEGVLDHLGRRKKISLERMKHVGRDSGCRTRWAAALAVLADDSNLE